MSRGTINVPRREHLLFIMHVYAENRGFYASVSPLRCYVLGFVIEIIVNFEEFSATLEREKVNAVAVSMFLRIIVFVARKYC